MKRDDAGRGRVIERYSRAGYYPARTAHLNPDLKQLLRTIRFRPGIKNCFQNCQYLTLRAHDAGLESRLQYHEGVALQESIGMPFEHAWLTLDGEVQDPTSTSLTYHESNTYSVERIREHVNDVKVWCPVDATALQRLFLVHIGLTDAARALTTRREAR